MTVDGRLNPQGDAHNPLESPEVVLRAELADAQNRTDQADRRRESVEEGLRRVEKQRVHREEGGEESYKEQGRRGVIAALHRLGLEGAPHAENDGQVKHGNVRDLHDDVGIIARHERDVAEERCRNETEEAVDGLAVRDGDRAGEADDAGER